MERRQEEITHVRVVYSDLPPFVEIKHENGKEIIDGFMPAIIRAVTQWMNLNVTWIHEPGNKYGSWNGTHYDGMVGMLQRDEVDFLVNPLIFENKMFEFADYVNPIIYEAFTFLSSKETEEGGLFLYFNILEPIVWACLGISLIVVAFVSALLFVTMSAGTIPYLLTLAEHMWFYTASTLGQATDRKMMLKHKNALLVTLLSLLTILWSIGVSFLIMTIFQSEIVSKLTIVRQHPIIDSIEEFVRQKNVLGITAEEIDLKIILMDSGIPVYEQAWKKMEPELVTGDDLFSEESLENVQKGKICLIHGHLILRTVLGDYFRKNARCNFHISDNMFFAVPLIIPVKKSLPRKFKDKLNLGVTRLVDVDISGKWFKPIFEEGHLCIHYSDNSLKPLNLNNIYGVLAIWGAGMLAATTSLIFENIYFTCYRKKKFQQRKRFLKARRNLVSYDISDFF